MHENNELWGHDSTDIFSVLGEANGFDPSPCAEQVPSPAHVIEEKRATPEILAPIGPQALIYRERVRTGQRIENPNGDLVVIGDVNNGAELVASGHIHVYGRFAGRALAGQGGHREALVFCSHFQGELVSIGGGYMLFEDMPPPLNGKAVVFALNDDRELCPTVI